MVKHIDIGKDFARALGPRFIETGPHSGEAFRQGMLEPAYLEHEAVVVHLDSIGSFSASFFEEAFGGLVRKYGLQAVAAKIRFSATARAYLVPMIEAWMTEADGRRLRP